MKVAVIGAGIIGITNAISLLEEGFDVTILTKDEPLKTNSDAAIATWYAPDSSRPLLQQNCISSLEKFRSLSNISGSGVQFIPIIYYFKDKQEFDKSPLRMKECSMLIPNEEYKNPGSTIGYEHNLIAQVPLADVNIYRPFLLERFYQKGGELIIKKVDSIDHLVNEGFRLIINCCGWESASLTSDSNVYPIRGQVEVAKLAPPVSAVPRLSVNIGSMNTYVIFRPQSNDVVVGATHQEHDSDLEVRAEDKKLLVERLRSIFPDLSSEDTFSKVGIRCGRKDLRLEEERFLNSDLEDALVVHCYGHGGSGFSASWGSALSVTKSCLSFKQEVERNFNYGLS